MNDTEQDRAAADWLARRDSGDWTGEQEAALAMWLEQSTANRVAYMRIEQIWSRADRMAALARVPSPAKLRRGERQWSFRSVAVGRAVAGGSVAVAACVAAIVFATLPSTVSTGIGERRTIALADGSSLELGPLSSVRYSIGTAKRSVWVDKGEAYFDVRHDAASPFIVLAGDKRIVDIGTRFSVRRSDTEMSVVVAEGRVEIGSIALRDQNTLTIDQGSLAQALGGAPFRVAHNPNEVANRLSWRDGMLAFDATPLNDVAAEFNRYNRQRLIIASTNVGAMRIGGRFRASHVDGFAALLKDAYGLKVVRTDEKITISE